MAGKLTSGARAWGFGLAAAIALCCTLLVPSAASATSTGSISGTVTAAGGAVDGAQVCAFSESTEYCASTDAQGKYTIAELEAGEYDVEFTGEVCDPGCTQPYMPRFYDEISEYEQATPVVLSAGQARSGVNAALVLGAAIEGKVESEHDPVEDTEVCADSEPLDIYECAVTNAAGEYAIDGLPEGEYTVVFDGQVCVSNSCTQPYLLQFYDEASEPSSARTIVLQPGARIPNVDASLEQGHSISGTVKSQTGVVPETQVCARIVGTDSSESCRQTNSAGAYAIEGLPAGEYTVVFTGEVCEPSGCTHPYLYQYYQGVERESEATRLPLAGHGSNAIDVNATLEVGGSITGTVRGPGGTPVTDTQVCAESEGFEVHECAETDAAGEYEIEGLRTGYYRVEFSGEVCTEERGEAKCSYPYAAQYYNDVSEEAEADSLLVTAGQTKPNIDAALMLGGRIDGTVTSAALGKPAVSGLEVCAYGRQSTSSERCASTDSAGDYSIEGLASGSYVVEFDGEVCGENGCDDEYLRQFYEATSEEENAKLVAVSAPAAVTGIDATVYEANPKVPGVLAAPTLTGNAVVGGTLYCSEGSYSNNPTRLAYEWLRDGAPIPAASANSYAVTTADEGQALACEVSVLNAAGSTSARSNSLAIPAKLKPPPAASHGSAVARGTATEKKGKVLLDLICTGSGPCAGEVVLIASVTEKRGKHHRSKLEKLTIGKASFSLATGAKKTLAVKLAPKGKALIASAGKHGLKVQLSGSDLASRTLIIKASSKKKKKKKKKKKG
ncbi:MAG TPA: carboxypeptidase regulatory-like domain-containing protein [Solirubrobacteraceae bacterium]|jgi:hypothetical protein